MKRIYTTGPCTVQIGDGEPFEVPYVTMEISVEAPPKSEAIQDRFHTLSGTMVSATVSRELLEFILSSEPVWPCSPARVVESLEEWLKADTTLPRAELVRPVSHFKPPRRRF